MFGGILLDGVDGIPVEARGNLCTFVHFMKSNQHVVAIQVCVREVGSTRAQQCLLAQNPLATDILHLVTHIVSGDMQRDTASAIASIVSWI